MSADKTQYVLSNEYYHTTEKRNWKKYSQTFGSAMEIHDETVRLST